MKKSIIFLLNIFLLFSCKFQVIESYNKLQQNDIKNNFTIKRNDSEDTITYTHINFAANHIRYLPIWEGRIFWIDVVENPGKPKIEMNFKEPVSKDYYLEIRVGGSEYKIFLKQSSIRKTKVPCGRGCKKFVYYIQLKNDEIINIFNKINDKGLNVECRIFGPMPKDSIIEVPKRGRRIGTTKKIDVKQYVSEPYVLTDEDKIGLMQSLDLYDILLKKIE